MREYFCAENLKIKRTFMKRLAWNMPIMTMLLVLFLEPSYFQNGIYNFWYTLLLPASATLVFVGVSKVDGKMKDKSVLALPVDRKKVWLAKVLIGIKYLLLSCLLIFALAECVPYLLGLSMKEPISIGAGLAASLVLVITFAWQVPICMYLQSKVGMALTLILSIFINFIGSILAVAKFWWAVPFSYPARLMCPILKMLPNGLPAKSGVMTYTPEIVRGGSIPFGLVMSIILLVGVTYWTARWYEAKEAV